MKTAPRKWMRRIRAKVEAELRKKRIRERRQDRQEVRS